MYGELVTYLKAIFELRLFVLSLEEYSTATPNLNKSASPREYESATLPVMLIVVKNRLDLLTIVMYPPQ